MTGLWFTKEEFMAKAQKMYDHEHSSVGQIVGETDDFIGLAATTDNDPEDPLYSDGSMIPKALIIRTEELRSEHD